MVLDEAGSDMECSDDNVTSLGDCMGDINIFKGRRSECLQNGWSTSFFNCCNDSVGSFIFLEERCPKESVETVQAKQADRLENGFHLALLLIFFPCTDIDRLGL